MTSPQRRKRNGRGRANVKEVGPFLLGIERAGCDVVDTAGHVIELQHAEAASVVARVATLERLRRAAHVLRHAQHLDTDTVLPASTQ